MRACSHCSTPRPRKKDDRKKDEELVSTLRTLTKGVVPGLPSMDKAAFFSKKAALRSVFTRVAHMPLMADDGP